LEAAAQHVAREKLINPPDDPTSGIERKIWRAAAKMKYIALMIVVEYFLVLALMSCASLHRDRILGDMLYVSMILCAVLYHMFIVGASLYLVARAICNWEALRWLRGTKFHRVLLKVCLMPVCKYLSSVGLGRGEKCPDASDDWGKDQPLTRKELLEFESNIQDAIRSSERRILRSEARVLHTVESAMFQRDLVE